MPNLRAVLAALVLLPACHLHPPDAAADSARLRASFAKHRQAYLEGLDAENRLLAETRQWLPSAKSGDRSSCRFVDPWSRVYFNPREIQFALREGSYSAPAVRRAHAEILDRLKTRYFILHDYQRYAQYDCEGRNGPAQFDEFRRRLDAHAPAKDEVTPILESLPAH